MGRTRGGLLLLLLGVVACGRADDGSGTDLPGRGSAAASDVKQSSPLLAADRPADTGGGEGSREVESSEVDEPGGVGVEEDGHGAGSGHSYAAPSASSRMLLVGKDLAPPLAANATTNRTRDLLTWRLKDQTRLKDLTNKILASVKDQWRRSEQSGMLNKHPHDVSSSRGQSEAGSQVVERRVAPPKQFGRRPGRLNCSRQRCKSANETMELRRRLLHDLRSSYSAPLPSRIRYRLKKKPSIYTSKKPSTRHDIGVPDIYESEVSITPKLRRRPSTRRTQDGRPNNEFGFAADRKFQQFVLPEVQQHVALEALGRRDYASANDEASTQPYIPLSPVPGAERPSSLVYRPPKRPPGSQRLRTSGLLRRPSPAEPHYFTTPSSLQHLSIQAHLPYRRPVSFRYSRTGTTAHAGPTRPSSPFSNVRPSSTPLFGKSTPPVLSESKAPQKTTSGRKPTTEPPRTYLPPTKDYIPPEPPQQAPASKEPPRKYLPPNQEYKPPPKPAEEPHSQPPRKYLPPNKEYLPPKVEGQGDSLPPPPQKYEPPTNEYLPPKAEGQGDSLPRPPQKYEPPTNEYLPPKTVPNAPSRHYLPPNKNYKIPVRRPQRPPSEHATTAAGYPEPPRKYLPPNKDFGSDDGRPSSRRRRPPNKRRRKNRKRPTPPGRKYLPPDKEYLPPPSASKQHSEEPLRTYEAPTKEYLPPKDYTTDSVTATTATVPYAVPPRTYLPPRLDYSTPAPTYTTPTPSSDYVPPHIPTPPTTPGKQPHTGYSPPTVTYEPPVRTYQPPSKDYLPPQGTTLPSWLQSIKTDQGSGQPEVYVSRFPPPLKIFADHHTTPLPAYSPPVRTYQPPVREYLPPTTPKVTYTGPPPPPPSLHRPLDPAFLPVPKKPSSHYLPPQVDYLPPGHADASRPPSTPKPHYITIVLPPETSPKPDYVPPAPPKKEYVPPSSPKPDYVPPSSPKPDYVSPSPPEKEYVPPSTPKAEYVPPSTPKQEYVPPSPPKEEYVPPSSPKPAYVPPSPTKPEYIPPKVPTSVAPSRRPAAHATTYKPSQDPKVKKLQDFSQPGDSRPSRPPAVPVYIPTTPGPGYNELPPHITAYQPLTPRPLIEDYYDDNYYYDDDDDDYYYYYDDDDDDDYYYDDDDYYDYYYYYDDYDYAPYPVSHRTPYQLTFQDDYDIHESDILDYGYIAGIPGRAGRDYPILSYIPLTSFGCDLVADYPGYYADMEAGCQVFHICHRSGRQDSFLCPNGTVFNQKYFVCDWWYNFACEDAPFFYPVNAAIGQPGVPLHRNAFEPDYRVVHSLPPLHPRPLLHAQPHPATPIPRHPGTARELVTLAPLPPQLVHPALG
ncbi:adhesive plaque matrix protein-like isoform X2 [Eriocheir sinensis]|uniref:adhesive plaque matrix protein-like isoform X2 n=1 Tax=Eriocheir sinensis TaxID=95602 RepID=UPI0021C84F57|nr:adhesive plaque matrix protein-like isoform X2 [Eriocheir sinensis]